MQRPARHLSSSRCPPDALQLARSWRGIGLVPVLAHELERAIHVVHAHALTASGRYRRTAILPVVAPPVGELVAVDARGDRVGVDVDLLQVSIAPPRVHCSPRSGGALTLARELAGAGEDRVEHRLGQLSGERVLLAGVIAADQPPARRPWRARRRGRSAAWAAPRQPARRVPGEGAQARSRPAGSARAPRLRRAGTRRAPPARLVGGRRAAHRRRHPRAVRRRPSSRPVEVGWLANPARCSAANSQSPERSPVNTRPVRLPPCAAGARPSTYTRAAGSPKPGTGLPQYSSSR